jgi:uncharacterized protein (DUF4415 family)
MTKQKLLKEFEPGHGFSKEDWDDVSDNPEWTEEDFRNARPFAEVFPELAESLERDGLVVIGDPAENQVVAVERRIVRKFREQGPDWQQRINDVLRKAVGL